MSMPSSCRSGKSRCRHVRASLISSSATCRISSSTSAGVRPSVDSSTTPASICCLRPATRTMKNSARMEPRMERNLARSRSGLRSSCASSSTRRKKDRTLSSRLKYWCASGGTGGCGARARVGGDTSPVRRRLPFGTLPPLNPCIARDPRPLLLRQQQALGGGQLLELVPTDLGVLQVQGRQRLDDGGGHDDAREPLVVGGHDVPGSIPGRRVLDHVLVGRHVLVPEAALLDIGAGEL